VSKVEVGSLWVAKEDYPLSAGVREGDVVVVKEVKESIIYTLLTEKDLWWISNFNSWDNHFKPYDGEPAMNLGYFNYPDIDDTGDIADNVNNPSHYGQGKIEAIEYISDFLTTEEYQGYLRGNIAKYLHRFPYKNGIEDLKKAQWYLERLIEEVE